MRPLRIMKRFSSLSPSGTFVRTKPKNCSCPPSELRKVISFVVMMSRGENLLRIGTW